MGAWGTELFENDAACDVQDAFTRLIPKGTSVEGAVGHVIGRHLSGQAADVDKRAWLEREADPDTVLALAWCVQRWRMRQPGAGPLMRAVLARAAQIASEETGLDEWLPERQAARRRVYREVAQRLAGA